MSFRPSSAAAFTSPGMTQGLRVEQAVGKPVVRDVAAFEISGIGLAAQNQPASASPAMAPAAAVASPKPETPASVTLAGAPGPLENRVWVLLSGIAAIFSAIAYAVWKRRKRTA
jgi:hypothetical protein